MLAAILVVQVVKLVADTQTDVSGPTLPCAVDSPETSSAIRRKPMGD
jgi:hypothetical protein